MEQKRGIRVTVLAEDERLAYFARSVLRELGIHSREIFLEPVPGGQQSGEQYVCQRYPQKVALLRSKVQYQQVMLVVGTDADKRSVLQRKRQLDKALTENGMRKRDCGEPIAIWVPARNVETWFQHFAGEVVEEKKDYKNQVQRPDYHGAARGFVGEFHKYQNDPDGLDTLLSLRRAYEETLRILRE